ncbi:hypothetical protein KCP69_01840 [Salmonella enterica subsp. enterica]|nr:hypothetical protein KCP69_01840 [Salmonella enterica subsp. enterica]
MRIGHSDFYPILLPSWLNWASRSGAFRHYAPILVDGLLPYQLAVVLYVGAASVGSKLRK